MQFCDAQDGTEKGLNKGELFHWNVFSNVATQGGTLTETATMPETKFTITQGTLTVTESGNSVPYTGKLDDLSEQPVKQIIRKALKDDCRKSLDIQAYNQFDATPLRVVPTGGTATDTIVLTTDGTATATNNVAMGKEHIKVIADTMKERNIPPFLGDDYIGLSHPTTWRNVKNDLESVHQHTPEGFRTIINGEMGRYEGVRFVEQTFIPKGGAADSTTFDPETETADAWDNGESSWAFFFGDDTVAEAICIPEEIRAKIPSDYGRSKGVAWYYLGGFGIVHGPAMSVVNARIVKWDSAS